SAHDDDTNAPTTASASDSVTYQDVAPSISITKAHNGASTHGTTRQTQTSTITPSATSTATTDPVTVTSLSDSVLGDLLPAFITGCGGSATTAYSGSLSFYVNYAALRAHASFPTRRSSDLSAHDDDTNAPTTASASDSVTYQDVAPSISITKAH